MAEKYQVVVNYEGVRMLIEVGDLETASLLPDGPDRLAFFLSPKPNMTVSNIDLIGEIDESKIHFNGRPLYFILSQYGKDKEDVSFSIDIKVPPNWIGSTMDLVVAARWVHEESMNRTLEFTTLLNQMPSWADVTAWVAAYYSYIL